MLNLNFSDFLIENKLILENQKINNYQISGTRIEDVNIQECNFENSVFENIFEENSVFIEKCTFINCKFSDIFKGDDLLLVMMNNTFKNCVFENVSYNVNSGQSEVVDSEFSECIFRNIEIKGDLSFIDLTFRKSCVEFFCYEGNQILGNRFLDMNINNSVFRGALLDNRIERGIFRNVKLIGWNKDNIFIDCDTSGVIFNDVF